MGFRRDHRFLRSDGTPDFSSRKRISESELEPVMRRDVVTVHKTTPVKECAKKMSTSGFRRLPVVAEERKLEGIVTATDLVNYLGGGEYYAIVEMRHKGVIYSALREPVSSIMTRGVISADYHERLSSVIEKMLRFNIGGLPVTSRGEVVGMVTEHDVLKAISDRIPDIKVSDVMTRDVVCAEIDESLMDVAKKIVSHGVRRLPVLSRGKVVGVVSTMDIVRYIASAEPYRRVILGLVEEAMEARVADVASPYVVSVHPSAGLREAYRLMMEREVGMLVVISGKRLLGVITERDLLLAALSERRGA